MKVRIKHAWSRTYPELTLGNVYRVIGIEADDLRIISDAGEPILFNAKAFEFVDATHPATWISERGQEGELYASPPDRMEGRRQARDHARAEPDGRAIDLALPSMMGIIKTAADANKRDLHHVGAL